MNKRTIDKVDGAGCGNSCSRALRRLPPADVVPVVHCYYCQWYESDCGWCEYWDGSANFDDFCSRGERKG